MFTWLVVLWLPSTAYAAAQASRAPDPAPRPTVTAPSPSQQPGYAEPLSALGAASPTCRSALGGPARRNCERTGSVAHPYPINSYGFDVQVGFSLTDLGDSFLGALQSLAALVWMALVYLVKGVLLLLEWAFSLDLLGAAMRDVRTTLDRLHRDVLGEPWFLAALSVTALWGMWRGLVQGRTTQTITGLASTVGLMVAGLVVLSNPTGTVGHASSLVNDASLGVLAAATSEPVDRPSDALASAMAGVFDRTVRNPWCALEFGSVTYCSAHAQGSRTLSNADVWLAYPAQSKERKALFKLLKGEKLTTGRGVFDVGGRALDLVGLGGERDADLPDDVRARVAKAPERAAMQEAGGTFPRFALLALIAAGMSGAICLLAYIGIRLLLASMLALLLLLFTPAVLLAPAFGESGRATFLAWARRLIGALAAKLIYALFLALVLAASATVGSLRIGWFGVWLLQIGFWWGVLLKRDELLGFASAGASHASGHASGGSTLGQMYYGAQVGRTVARMAQRGAEHAAVPVQAGRRTLIDRRQARQAAIAGLASEALDHRAERAITTDQRSATERLSEKRQLERELRVVDRRLMGYDEAHATATAERTTPPAPDAEQATLLRRRSELLASLAAPELHAAEQIARHAAINRAQTGGPVSSRDFAAHLEARRRDLAADLPVDDERHLRAAGIDPAAYRHAPDDERALLRATVEGHLADERRMLEVVDGNGEVRFDPALVRRRSAEERAKLRAERRSRAGRLRSRVR